MFKIIIKGEELETYEYIGMYEDGIETGASVIFKSIGFAAEFSAKVAYQIALDIEDYGLQSSKALAAFMKLRFRSSGIDSEIVRQFKDAYIGEFESKKGFILEHKTCSFEEVEKYVDYDKWWEAEWRFDYLEVDGFFFHSH